MLTVSDALMERAEAYRIIPVNLITLEFPASAGGTLRITDAPRDITAGGGVTPPDTFTSVAGPLTLPVNPAVGDLINVTVNTPTVAWTSSTTGLPVRLLAALSNRGINEHLVLVSGNTQLHLDTPIANTRDGTDSPMAIGVAVFGSNGNSYPIDRLDPGRWSSPNDLRVTGDASSTFANVNELLYYNNPTTPGNFLTPGGYRWDGNAWVSATVRTTPTQTGGTLFSSNNTLSGVEPPQTISAVDRDVYSIRFSDVDNAIRDRLTASPNGVPMSIPVGIRGSRHIASRH